MSVIYAPYKPLIRSITGYNASLVPNIIYRIGVEPLYETATLYDLADSAKPYVLGYGYTEAEARQNCDDSTGSNLSPGSNDVRQYYFCSAPNGDDNLIIYPTPNYFFGKTTWLAIKRRLSYSEGTNVESEAATDSFYMPHYDEPLYDRTLTNTLSGVNAFMWSSSADFSEGAVTPDGDSCKQGDVYVLIRSDNSFHKVCLVISFYNHAATTGVSGEVDTPYYNGVPLYFSEESGSAYLYSNEASNNIQFTTETEAKFIDRWWAMPYSFTDGQHYSVLVGNLSVCNNFDCVRFRLANAPSFYQMYIHVLVDGSYLSADNMYIGRGYAAVSTDTSTFTKSNGYDIGTNVKKLSTLSSATDCAVKIVASRTGSPLNWTFTPTSHYETCPGESVNC